MTIRSEGRRSTAGCPRPRGDLGCENSLCSPVWNWSCRGGSRAVLVMDWYARPLMQLSLLRWFQHRPRCQGVVCVLREPTEAAGPRQAAADEHSRYRLLLNRFSRVRLCATPEMAADQAPPSLGFSRQEHWSGLPFPSPIHESEK